jgi:pimeloyl-ACP methyl ester carboxylesterase
MTHIRAMMQLRRLLAVVAVLVVPTVAVVWVGNQVSLGAAQAAAGTSYDGYERVSAIRAPTLVLHGTDDNVVATENAEILGRLIPDARVELFEGCGHLFFWEQPERFVRVVTEFLG